MKRMMRYQILAVAALVVTACFGLRALGQGDEQAERLNQRSKADTDEGKMQCPMMAAMKGVKLFADSPPVLLGQEEKLNLTDQQQRQLEEIGESARKRAISVLNAEQRKQVAQAPSGPLSMMQLAKLQKENETGGERKAMCPMCTEMMRRKMKTSSPGKNTDQQLNKSREK